jgi:hypothetical protein
MRVSITQKLVPGLLLLLPTLAAASDFNSIFADLIFIPAHLILGAAALVFLVSGVQPRTGFIAGALLTPLAIINSLFVWSMGRPRSIALEWQSNPLDVAISALVIALPVLLSGALLARYRHGHAA